MLTWNCFVAKREANSTLRTWNYCVFVQIREIFNSTNICHRSAATCPAESRRRRRFRTFGSPGVRRFACRKSVRFASDFAPLDCRTPKQPRWKWLTENSSTVVINIFTDSLSLFLPLYPSPSPASVTQTSNEFTEQFINSPLAIFSVSTLSSMWYCGSTRTYQTHASSSCTS